MKFKTREHYGAVVVDIEGRLVGGPEAKQFHKFFKGLINEGKNRIIVNLGKVSWANSQGVGMLIGAHTSAKNAGGELVLVNVQDKIESILTVTRLLLIFTTFDSEDEAVKHLKEIEGDGD